MAIATTPTTAPTTTTTRTKQSLPELVGELRELVVTYAKQETVEPLKNLGRFVGFGLAGSLLVATSGVLLTLGVLRLLQEEAASTFDGDWSFVPYLIAMVVAGLGAALAARAITRRPTPGAR